MRRTKPPPTGRGLPPSIKGATVIGLGGVGRSVATQLAALGITRLLLVDPGNVPRAKWAADGYPCEDAGRPRVHATAQLCHQINPQLDLSSLVDWSLRRVDLGQAVLCCQCSGKDLPTLARRAQDRIIVARCDVQAARIRLNYTRRSHESAARVEGPRALALRISHSTIPIHIAALAAGLFVGELNRFAESGARWRMVRLDPRSLRIAAQDHA
jgi:molybdopterin/thiamine biosynthesis adenylyltransferase